MTRQSIRAAAAAAFLGAACGGASAESLSEAFAAAYASNPALVAARAAVRATDESVPTARAGLRPNVSASASASASSTDFSGQTPTSNTEPRQLSLDATQPLYDGGRTHNAVEGAIAGVNAARARLLDTEQSVLLDVVTAYMNTRRDQRFVALAESNVRLIREQLRAAEDRFEVGEVTRTDVSQARARLAEARAALAQQQGALARSRQAYLRVTGLVPGELAAPPQMPTMPPSLAAAIAEATAEHPQIAAARYDEESARKLVKENIGELLPSVALNGSVSYAEDTGGDGFGGDQSNATVQLQATIPLYQGGAAYSQIRAAQDRASQRLAELHDVARGIREEVENAWSDLQVSEVAIRAGRQQVDAARIAFEGVREEAKLGARTTLDVLDAEQELLNARTDLVATMRDEYVAGYALLSSLGRLTAADLGVDVAPYDPTQHYEATDERAFGFEADELTSWDNPIRP